MAKKGGPLENVWFLNVGVLLVALVLVAKLGYVQIARGEVYRDKAERQYTLPSGGSFDRGTIFFSEKTGRTISAATVIPDYTLAIDPTKVVNPAALADKLAAYVTFDREDLIARASRKGDQYEEVAKHLSEKENK